MSKKYVVSSNWVKVVNNVNMVENIIQALYANSVDEAKGIHIGDIFKNDLYKGYNLLASPNIIDVDKEF